MLLSVIALASCTGGGGPTPLPSGTSGGIYRDPAGWSIQVEPGWRVVPFSSSTGGVKAAGAQISNFRLPPPIVRSGFPIQANGLVLPARGIALVIGTDQDSKVARQGPIASPPLSYPAGWLQGSSTADDPSMATIWFQAGPGEQVFLATLKIGTDAWDHRSDLDAATRMIRSISF
ncbi:MAG: hypothetical protein M3Q23_05575 [Actinomycetota bacterium]|nr:hypothetical protein [Actinomycetota bacterium]